MYIYIQAFVWLLVVFSGIRSFISQQMPQQSVYSMDVYDASIKITTRRRKIQENETQMRHEIIHVFRSVNKRVGANEMC